MSQTNPDPQTTSETTVHAINNQLANVNINRQSPTTDIIDDGYPAPTHDSSQANLSHHFPGVPGFLEDQPIANASAVPSSLNIKPKIFRNADPSISETRPSRFVKPATTPLFHPEEVPADLQPVLKLYEHYNNKVYMEGYLYKMNDMTPEGRPFPTREWVKCYVELCGPILTFWEFDAVGDDRENGDAGALRPNYINITDSTVDINNSTQESPPRDHVFSLNSAGANRFFLQTVDERTLNRWVSAIRLSCFEIGKLHEIYTRTLLSRPSFKDILDKHSSRFEGYLQVRFTGTTEWQRYWVVVSDKRDEKKLFGKKSQASRGQCLFYETKKSKNPAMTLVNVYQAYAVYPETPQLVEKATILKVEGSLFGSIKASSPSESKSSSFVLLMAATNKEMASWLVASFDAFKLYGRPNALLGSYTEPTSMCFAQPAPEVDSGRLFLDLEEVEHIHMRGENLADVKMAFSDILQSKLQSQYQTLLPPPNNAYGRTFQGGDRGHDEFIHNHTMPGVPEILHAGPGNQRTGGQSLAPQIQPGSLRPSSSAEASRNRSVLKPLKKGRKVADSSEESDEESANEDDDDSEDESTLPGRRTSTSKTENILKPRPSTSTTRNAAFHQLPEDPAPSNSINSLMKGKKGAPVPSDSEEEDDDATIDSETLSTRNVRVKGITKGRPPPAPSDTEEDELESNVYDGDSSVGNELSSAASITRQQQSVAKKPESKHPFQVQQGAMPSQPPTGIYGNMSAYQHPSGMMWVGPSNAHGDSYQQPLGYSAYNAGYHQYPPEAVGRQSDGIIQQQRSVGSLSRPIKEESSNQKHIKRPTSIAASTATDLTEESRNEEEYDDNDGEIEEATSRAANENQAPTLEFGAAPKLDLDFSADMFNHFGRRPSDTEKQGVYSTANILTAEAPTYPDKDNTDYGEKDEPNENDDGWRRERRDSKDRRSSQQHEALKFGPADMRRSSSASGSRTSLTGSSVGSESNQQILPQAAYPQATHDLMRPRSPSPVGLNPNDRRWIARPPVNGPLLPSSASAYGDYEHSQGPPWDNETINDPRLMGRGGQGGMYYDDDDYQSVSGDFPRGSPGGARRGFRNEDTYSSYDYDEPRLRGQQVPGVGQNFVKQGSLLGMHMSEQWTAREQTEFARVTGQPLINVPIKPPEPQTGLVGMITQREQQRKIGGTSQRIADITGAMQQEVEREKSLEREREWRLMEQRQYMQQQQMMMMGAYGMMGMPMGGQYMGNMGVMPMGNQYLDPRYAMGMAQMPVGGPYLDPRLSMMSGAGMGGIGQVPMGMGGQYVDPRYGMFNAGNMGMGLVPGHNMPAGNMGNRSGSISGPSIPGAGTTSSDDEDDVPIGMVNSPLLPSRSLSPALGGSQVHHRGSFSVAKDSSGPTNT
ncbi:hypothetical protein BC938DRAFT_482391 [Jimgerdemannia flammicorona]|uniref:PH domain-containing protein n=1 Tax=Jimgerdemannia flammicorona TaxID=994334 RepID=A0A433QWB0_9FUNG|nr:hypothetical protein BC938DRAFT_482391 [Jimgerdemannia flammicorona]